MLSSVVLHTRTVIAIRGAAKCPVLPRQYPFLHTLQQTHCNTEGAEDQVLALLCCCKYKTTNHEDHLMCHLHPLLPQEGVLLLGVRGVHQGIVLPVQQPALAQVYLHRILLRHPPRLHVRPPDPHLVHLPHNTQCPVSQCATGTLAHPLHSLVLYAKADSHIDNTSALLFVATVLHWQ